MKPPLLLALLLLLVGCEKKNQNNGSDEIPNDDKTTLQPKLPKVAEEEASPSVFKYLAQGGQIVITGYNEEFFAKAKSEGNGGVIYSKTHYGRDSLIGIVLILSLLAERNISLSELRKTLPQFSIVKQKLNFDGNIKNVVDFFKQEYLKCKITTIDGIRMDFDNSWVHVRKSNTEPVVRVIAEAINLKEASRLAKEIMSKLQLI